LMRDYIFELYKRKDPISYYHIQSEEDDEWEKVLRK